MLTSAADILSAAAAKVALRIDRDDFDTEVETCVDAAVNYCARLAGRPYVGLTETFEHAKVSPASCPLVLDVVDVHAVTGIAYWQTDQTLREDPTGSVTVESGQTDAIGRVTERGGRTEIWPPADGWPEILNRSMFRITVERGFERASGSDAAANVPNIQGVRKAVSLLARIYYEGDSDPRGLQMVRDLLIPGSANTKGLAF